MVMLSKISLFARYLASYQTVKKELLKWRKLSSKLPEDLREQARSSLKEKQFHCLGGSIYMCYPGVKREVMLKAIISLQTISDYLDNLCDRMDINNASAFQTLHLSFFDALDPDAEISDYYHHCSFQESIYLSALVRECQSQLVKMPYYHIYQNEIMKLAEKYCDLQVRKHLYPEAKILVQNWAADNFDLDELAWYEWAAASGSTLNIFMFFAASFYDYSSKEIERITDVYFPWIQALHIMLDYLIDREEDLLYNDLNFTFFYSDPDEAVRRINYIYNKSRTLISELPHPEFHDLVLQGLIAMYGSDPKIKRLGLEEKLNEFFYDRFSKNIYLLALFLRRCKYLK